MATSVGKFEYTIKMKTIKIKIFRLYRYIHTSRKRTLYQKNSTKSKYFEKIKNYTYKERLSIDLQYLLYLNAVSETLRKSDKFNINKIYSIEETNLFSIK